MNSNETLNAIATATGHTQSATASATYTFHEAIATVNPTSLAFGNQVQSIASVAQTVTLKNTGTGTPTLTGFPSTRSADCFRAGAAEQTAGVARGIGRGADTL